MAVNPCPVCAKPIAIDDLNLAQGVGLCRACGKLSKLADIAAQPDVSTRDVIDPPAGCRYSDPFAGEGHVLRASLRSPGTAIGLLAMCLFWNGIVSVFLSFAIAGLYTHLIGPLPKWYPLPGSGKGKPNSPTESLGTTIFLCLFLTPFVLIGTGMIVAFLLAVAGRIEVRLQDSLARVRTGIGPLNWTRRFDPARVKRVTAGRTKWESNGRAQETVQIETDQKTFAFGSTLPDYRRKWLIDALHLLLVAPGKEMRQRQGLSASPRN